MPVQVRRQRVALDRKTQVRPIAARRKLGADPAVATSPFVTTMNDLLGSSIIIFCTWLLLL